MESVIDIIMKNQKIVIIDYGMGNIGSIQNMLKYLGADSIVTADKKEIENDMNMCLKQIKKKSKKNPGRKQREEISKSATRGLSFKKINVSNLNLNDSLRTLTSTNCLVICVKLLPLATSKLAFSSVIFKGRNK